MARITRDRLSRGVKVTRDHAFGLFTSAAAEMGTSNINPVQLETPRGSFRVNLHIPNIPATYWQSADAGQVRLCVPFCLPPLQEHFVTTGVLTDTVPEIILDEFQFSFDQRAEPCAIADAEELAGADTDGGEMNFLPVALDSLGLGVSLVEKSQFYHTGSTDYVPTREIFAVQLERERFDSRYNRANPFALDNLGRTIHPYKSYLLIINAPALWATTAKSCLVSVEVSFRFLTDLVPRDTGAAIQNMPAHNGGKTGATVSVNTPAAGAPVCADGALGTGTGLQDHLNRFDNEFINKLQGGYTMESGAAVREHLDEDACYEVVAVPMWGNLGRVGYLCPDTIDCLPNAADDPDLPIFDRRWIPLHYPIVIHHVILGVGYAAPNSVPLIPPVFPDGTPGPHPTAATFVNRVGVGLFTGVRGDHYAYDSVAYEEWTPATKVNFLIDRIRHHPASSLSSGAWDYELLQCGLVGAGGTGYYAQGRPVWAGRATNRYQIYNPAAPGTARSNLGGSVPDVRGMEQFLEVRWEIEDPAGLDNHATGTVQIPVGGHWCFIIGKKHLAMGDGEIKL